MNDIVPYRPLSYRQQLDRSEELMRQLISNPLIELRHFKELRDLQAQLRMRIKKQEEETQSPA